MSWSKLYKDVLSASCNEWIAVKGKRTEKQEFLEGMVTTIQQISAKDHPEEPPITGLLKKITTWYQNNVKSPKANDDPETRKGVNSYIKTYTVRDACKRIFKNRIHDLVQNKTDSKSGSPEWLKHYSSALAEVYHNLDEDEISECRDQASKWNKDGPADEIQQQNANRLLTSTVNKFLKDMQRTMGVQMFIIAGHSRPDGNISRHVFESTPAQGGLTFTKAQPDWKKKTWDQYGEYLGKQFKDNDDDNDDDDGDNQDKSDDEDQPKVTELVQVDNDNRPHLHKLTSESLETRKKIIRQYITLSYRHFTSNPRAIVPWKDISLDNNKYVDPDSLPDNIQLREPSKLRLTELVKLWDYWRKRQAAGHPGLDFIHANSGDIREKNRKGKERQTTPWTDLDDDDPPAINVHTSLPSGPGQASGAGQASGSGQQRPNPPADTESDDSNHHDDNIPHDDNPHEDDIHEDDPHDQSPVAHMATKKHRMIFLRSLCRHDSYLSMLKAMERQTGSKIIENMDAYPDWVSWQYDQLHLPEYFHTKQGYKHLVKALEHPVEDTYSAQEFHALAVGLGLRDINYAVFGDIDLDIPDHVTSSPLGQEHWDNLLELCQPEVDMTEKRDVRSSKKRKNPPREKKASQPEKSPTKKQKLTKRNKD